MRNSPTLANLVLHHRFFRDGGLRSLEEQIISPVHDPVEMDHDIIAAAEALKDVEPYKSMSQRAYQRELDMWVITRAIASYERTLLSGWSRYDRYLQGEVQALTEPEKRGLAIFNSAEAGCSQCHGGFDLSDHGYYNVGSYLAYADPGRERITLNASDNGKFKVPTLRNIALTAPYMHDGSLRTLGEVVDHFASGGKAHPNKSELIRPFELDEAGRADLIAFLHALTDDRELDQVK
jgi:cytochrome c peroxidase